MKYLLLFLLLSACGGEMTIGPTQWIREHPKPIVCIKGPLDAFNESRWTLIDAKGEVFITVPLLVQFPDTIKAVR